MEDISAIEYFIKQHPELKDAFDELVTKRNTLVEYCITHAHTRDPETVTGIMIKLHEAQVITKCINKLKKNQYETVPKS